jgi:hypothetical protein
MAGAQKSSQCHTLEAAVKLWETRSILQLPGRELS